MLKPKIPVAQEGYPFIYLAAFCTLVFAVLGFTLLAIIGLILSTFILSFFRDPERFTPADPAAVISPADGKVIIVEKVASNQFTNNEAYKVSIFMNVFNVHVNRAPVDAQVDRIVYTPGKFYSADSPKAALENEYCATIFTLPQGQTIACVQIAGLIARRIICWLEPGDVIKKGRRYGLIRFGSRVDLYLPVEADITVQVGTKVRAGESIIATL